MLFRRNTPSDLDGDGDRRLTREDMGRFQVIVDRNLCFYCGACVAICPPDSIFLENAHLAIDDETCTRCERCIRMCPVHALLMVESVPHDQGA